MELIKVSLDNPDPDAIVKASSVLRSGGLLVYPTDTVYGLGANALNEKAVKKAYEVKGRDYSKPTHVVVTDWKMIEELTETNELAKKLYNHFLPGPLTIVLPKKKTVPDILTSGLPTLGVRIPNNSVTQSLSRLLTFPYTTPSANKSGGKSPYSVDDVTKQLDPNRIGLILDAGKLPPTPPSTIIDLTFTPFKILRKGPITKAQIQKRPRAYNSIQENPEFLIRG